MGEPARLLANDGSPIDCRRKEFGSHRCSRMEPLTVQVTHQRSDGAVALPQENSLCLPGLPEIILHLEVLQQFRRARTAPRKLCGQMVGNSSTTATSSNIRLDANAIGIEPST